MSVIPLSLYVHFPWCVRKCPYCDFNSHTLKQDLPEKDYIDALIHDLRAEQQGEERRDLKSVFLGGGTPSLFSGDAVDQLLKHIEEFFSLTSSEITIEANPGTYDQSNFLIYRQAGVNRLSLGAQSFNQRYLQSLGRIHRPDDIFNAFSGARSAGFSRINIDLMFGLPGQDIGDAMADLEQAIALNPEHISWYQLTIEPNTVFHRFPPARPDEDTLAAMTKEWHRLLTENGFHQYEVSAFARPGEAAQHNLNYWQFGDYIGIGAGAHGKLTRDGIIVRTQKTRMPSDYLANTNRRQSEISSDDVTLEFLMNALRLTEGFELSIFSERTGQPTDRLAAFVDRATERGFTEKRGDWLVPTELDRNFLDDLLLLH